MDVPQGGTGVKRGGAEAKLALRLVAIVDMLHQDFRQREVMAMGTMNFSIPDDVKDAFNEVFKDENKSAVITNLIRDAVEKRRLREQRRKAIEAIDELRKTMPSITQDEIRALRDELRK